MTRLTEAMRSTPARWLGLVAVSAALVVLGTLAGWRLAGPVTTETAIGRVSLEINPSLSGDATAFVPLADWGFRADAFDAPFEVSAELRSLDRRALGRAAEGDLSVLTATEDDLSGALREVALRATAWGLGAAAVLLVLATMLWRRLRPRWALLALGAGVAALGAGATALAAQASFDARAFESPTYFARGAELQRILEIAEDERVSSEYGSTFASVLRSVSAVLTDAPAGEVATRDLYVASDLHGNALVVGPLSDLVGDAPLLLAGDFGQRGGEAESAALAPRVAALGTRVVAVSGNHDSSELMRRLDAEGVTVLEADGPLGAEGEEADEPVIDVDGLTVAGFPDPLQWRGAGDPPSRPVTFDDLDDPEQAFGDATEDLVEWFDALPERPDVVVVHQNALAQALALELHERGDDTVPLTIVTGHDHRQHVERYGGIVVVDGGSVGAGGVFDAGRAPIGLARLHFEPVGSALGSVDLIAVEPFSGQAQASKVVINSMCPEEESCSFEPGALAGSRPGE
jgi:predicted phosphodiesterase